MLHTILTTLVKLAGTEAVKKLILSAAEELVKRTDNTLDDAALQVFKDILKEMQ